MGQGLRCIAILSAVVAQLYRPTTVRSRYTLSYLHRYIYMYVCTQRYYIIIIYTSNINIIYICMYVCYEGRTPTDVAFIIIAARERRRTTLRVNLRHSIMETQPLQLTSPIYVCIHIYIYIPSSLSSPPSARVRGRLLALALVGPIVKFSAVSV